MGGFDAGVFLVLAVAIGAAGGGAVFHFTNRDRMKAEECDDWFERMLNSNWYAVALFALVFSASFASSTWRVGFADNPLNILTPMLTFLGVFLGIYFVYLVVGVILGRV